MTILTSTSDCLAKTSQLGEAAGRDCDRGIFICFGVRVQLLHARLPGNFRPVALIGPMLVTGFNAGSSSKGPNSRRPSSSFQVHGWRPLSETNSCNCGRGGGLSLARGMLQVLWSTGDRAWTRSHKQNYLNSQNQGIGSRGFTASLSSSATLA